MISLVQSLPAGNAVRLFVTPPAGATETVVLRKTANTFTGYNDPGALVVVDAADVHAVMDLNNVINGTAYWYADYSLVAGVWVAGNAVSITPAANYTDSGTAVLAAVQDRVVKGMAVELAKGTFTHRDNKIPVLLATPTYEDAAWPIITMSLANDDPSIFFVGGGEINEGYDSGLGVNDYSDGYLSSVRISLVVWSLNADERRTLREALARVLAVNLPIFEELGLYQVTFSRQDTEDMASYPAPVYQSIFSLSCIADKSVMSSGAPITAIDLAVTAIN